MDSDLEEGEIKDDGENGNASGLTRRTRLKTNCSSDRTVRKSREDSASNSRTRKPTHSSKNDDHIPQRLPSQSQQRTPIRRTKVQRRRVEAEKSSNVLKSSEPRIIISVSNEKKTGKSKDKQLSSESKENKNTRTDDVSSKKSSKSLSPATKTTKRLPSPRIEKSFKTPPIDPSVPIASNFVNNNNLSLDDQVEDISDEEEDNRSIISVEVVAKAPPEIVTIDSSPESALEDEEEEEDVEELQLRRLALQDLMLRLSNEEISNVVHGQDEEESNNVENMNDDDEPYSPFDEEEESTSKLQSTTDSLMTGPVSVQDQDRLMEQQQGSTTASPSSARHGPVITSSSILKEQNLMTNSQENGNETMPYKVCDTSSKENTSTFVQHFGLPSFEQLSSTAAGLPPLQAPISHNSQLLFPNPLFAPHLMTRDVDMRLPMTNFITNSNNNNNLLSNPATSMGPSTAALPPLFEQSNPTTTQFPSVQPFLLNPLSGVNPFNNTSRCFGINPCFTTNNFISTMANGLAFSTTNATTDGNPTLFPPSTFNVPTVNVNPVESNVNQCQPMSAWTSLPINLPSNIFPQTLASTSKDEQFSDIPLILSMSSIPEEPTPKPPPIPTKTLLPPAPPPPKISLITSSTSDSVHSPDEDSCQSPLSFDVATIPLSPPLKTLDKNAMDDEISCVLEKIISRAKSNSSLSSRSDDVKKSDKKDHKDDKRYHSSSSKSLKESSGNHSDKHKSSKDSSKSSTKNDGRGYRSQKQSNREQTHSHHASASSKTRKSSQSHRSSTKDSGRNSGRPSSKNALTTTTTISSTDITSTTTSSSSVPTVAVVNSDLVPSTTNTDNNIKDSAQTGINSVAKCPSVEPSVVVSPPKPPVDVDADEMNSFEDEEVLRAQLLLDISRKNKDAPPPPLLIPQPVAAVPSSANYRSYVNLLQQQSNNLRAILRKRMIPAASSQYPYVKDNTQLHTKTIINPSSKHRQIIRVVDRNRPTTTMSLNNLINSTTKNNSMTRGSPNMHSIQRTIINTNHPFYNPNVDPLMKHLRKSVVNQNVTPLIIRINHDESSSDEGDSDAKKVAEKSNGNNNKENGENKTVEKKNSHQQKVTSTTTTTTNTIQQSKDSVVITKSQQQSTTNPNFTLPDDFELSLSHLLKASREHTIPKTTNADTTNAPHEEEHPKEDEHAGKHVVVTDADVDRIEITPPVTAINPEIEVAKEREELYLRERLLKATLIQKMKDSKDRLILRKLENDLLSARRRINQELTTLLADMVKMSDLKGLYKQEQEKVSMLRRQLSAAVKKVNSTAECLDVEEKKRKTLTSHVFSMRKECVQLVKECREHGCKIEGSNYKVPSAEYLEMKSKLVEVRNQNVVLRRSMGKISPKKVNSSANVYSSKRCGSTASATLAAANRVKKFFYSRKGKRVRLNSEMSTKFKPNTPRQVRWQINRRVQGRRNSESSNKTKKNLWLTKYGKHGDDDDEDDQEVFLLPKMLFKDVMILQTDVQSKFTDYSSYESPLSSIREFRESRCVH